MHAELGAVPAERATQAFFARLGIGTDVFTHEDCVGARLVDDVEALGHHVAASYDEPAPEGSQCSIEVGERVEQERQSIWGTERAQDLIVEHEQGYQQICSRGGGGESRMIVDAKVAGEEYDGRSQAPTV